MDVKRRHCWRCETDITRHLQLSCRCNVCSLAEYCSKQCQHQDNVRHSSVECQLFGLKCCNHCRKSGHMKECSACNNAWYCDSTCQMTNWTTHKEQCMKTKSYIKKTSPVMRAMYEYNGENIFRMDDPPAYFGNTIAVDFLNLQGNEWSELGESNKKELLRNFNLLSTGCGDLRNTVLTVASLPVEYQGNLYLTLDDFDPFVMARNVLFLFMIVRCADTDGIASSLATIWYSVHISKSDYKLLKMTLEELIQSSTSSRQLSDATNGIMIIQEDDISYLREVWEGWLALQCQRNKAQCINLCKQRRSVFTNDIDAWIGLPQYLRRLNPNDIKFMKKWFENGLFLPKDKKHDSLPFDNPTLTGRESYNTWPKEALGGAPSSKLIRPSQFTYRYCIRTDSSPLQAWDCLQVDQFTGQTNLQESVIARYHAYVTHLLQKNILFIGQKRLTIRIFLAHCLDFPNHHLTLRMPNYDRIFTSNMADYFGFCKLLNTFKPLLNTANKHSTIVTQTLNWIGSHTKDADVQFISKEEISRYHIMCQRDTGFSIDTSKDVNCHREYFNNTHWFLAYLRADIMAGGVGESTMDHIPKLSEVLGFNGMKMRDFRKELNRLVPFQYRVNARKITMENGMTRNVEWYLPQNNK